MNNYPEFIELKNKTRYKINTSYKNALKCDDVYKDDSIGEYEKNLAIIYILLGEEALKDRKNYPEIIELISKYLNRGNEVTRDDFSIPSMDFVQDDGYINASFMSDYGIDLKQTDMHWYKFFDYLQGLTENSVLNRVRSIREEPLSGKKGKELSRWTELKKQVELKMKKTKEERELDKFWEEEFNFKKR